MDVASVSETDFKSHQRFPVQPLRSLNTHAVRMAWMEVEQGWPQDPPSSQQVRNQDIDGTTALNVDLFNLQVTLFTWLQIITHLQRLQLSLALAHQPWKWRYSWTVPYRRLVARVKNVFEFWLWSQISNFNLRILILISEVRFFHLRFLTLICICI